MPRDINSKMDRLNIINREPIPSEGVEGDLTVRNTRDGLRLYVKYKNGWEGVGLSKRPFKVDRNGFVSDEKMIHSAKWTYENRSANFSETSDDEMYIPLSTQTMTESNTSVSGINEFLWFISPFDGYVEKISFRSVVAHNGTLKYEIFKLADGDDTASATPTETGEFSESINIADDTIHVMDLNKKTPASGSNRISKDTMIAIKMYTPSNPGDTNVNVLFRWDTTT